MIIYPSNYHDYQIGLAVEKSNIGIMINDRNLSHGYSKQLKDSIYKILSTNQYNKRIREIKEEFINLYKEEKIIHYLDKLLSEQ